ncbi:MAG: 50S ribosomal protein L17 [Nitrospinota bacterium]|nr:50S ribosomal protein L17 [Nitrospinota bacterium]
MRHKKKNARFDRTTSHRIAMFRNMVTSLLQYERITTTDAKAKELRGVADKMITLGKKGTLSHRRRALAFVRTKDVVHKLFSTLAERYKERNGGYTRLRKLPLNRVGDCAPMAIIELVDRDITAAPKRRVKKVEAKPAEA